MKKTKLFTLVAMLLVVATLLASCGSDAEGLAKISSLSSVLNTNYDPYADEKVSASAIDGLDGYTYEESDSDFAVFTKTSYEANEQTIKIVSLRKGAVILSVTSSKEAQYSVELGRTTPTFIVHKQFGEDFSKDRYTLYDAAGNTVASHSSEIEEPSLFADLILYDSTLYEEDENGNLKEVATIAENLQIDTPDEYNEKYFYFTSKKSVTVYDRNFKLKTLWKMPSDADNSSISVLNNGNVLIQYLMQLDPETTKYDVIDLDDEVTKYDLHTYILNVETGKTTAVETDYLFAQLVSNYTITENDDKNNNYFAKNFENFAIAYKITDKRIDTTTTDIVLVNNDGKITSSVKIADHQSDSLPQKIANDTYLVYTEYGRAIINGKGETLLTIQNDSLDIIGSYIVSEKAIYNLKMEVIYSLNQNDATIIGDLNGVIFIAQEINDTTYEVLCLRNGEIITLCTVDTASDHSNRFNLDEDGGFYYVYRSATAQYSYFNSKGDLLITSDYSLHTTAMSSAHGTAIIQTSENEYYLLTK